MESEKNMTISEEIKNEITKKEKYINTLNNKLDEITELKITEANERTKLMTGNFTGKIEGKITEKAKVAYCDKKLEKQNNKIKWLETDINKLKKRIELCNDKISCYKYMIKEMEVQQ